MIKTMMRMKLAMTKTKTTAVKATMMTATMLMVMLMRLSACSALELAPMSMMSMTRQLDGDPCDDATDEMYNNNPDLQAANMAMEKAEDMDITQQGERITVSYPQGEVQALTDACDDAGGRMIGTDDQDLDCLSVEGNPIELTFRNTFVCASAVCTGENDYPTDELLVDLAGAYRLTCTIKDPNATPSPTPTLLPKWEACEDDSEQFIGKHPEIEALLQKMEQDMTEGMDSGGFRLGFAKDDTDQLRTLCEAAGGAIVGVQEEVFDCKSQGAEVELTMDNFYECFPSGCDGYPLEQQLLKATDAMDLDCVFERSSDNAGDSGSGDAATLVPSSMPSASIGGAADSPAPSDSGSAPSEMPTSADQDGMENSSGPTPMELAPTPAPSDVAHAGNNSSSDGQASEGPTAVAIGTSTDPPTTAPTDPETETPTSQPTTAPHTLSPKPTPSPMEGGSGNDDPTVVSQPETQHNGNTGGSNDQNQSSSSGGFFDTDIFPPHAIAIIVGAAFLVIGLSCISVRRRQRRNRAELVYQMSELRMSDPDDAEALSPIT